MSFYSKIGFLSLLSVSTFFAMEKAQPPQPVSQLENDVIPVQAYGTIIAKIERRHLKASPSFKGLIDDVSIEDVIELPESMAEDFKAVRDYLITEYCLQKKEVNEKSVNELFCAKSEAELATLINACQRFELNKLSPLLIRILTQKFIPHERLTECLKKGSFGLALTPDTAKLVAQEMLKSNNGLRVYWLIIEEIVKNKYITIIKAHFPSQKVEYGYHGQNRINDLFAEVSQEWAFVDEAQEKKINTESQNALGFTLIKDRDSSYIYCQHQNSLVLIQLSKIRSNHYFDTQLTPEQVALLYHFKSDRLKSSIGNHTPEKYPGIESIKKTMPNNIQTLIDPESWWSTLAIPSMLATAAIAVGTAWFAYSS